jgi:hypothetical protein
MLNGLERNVDLWGFALSTVGHISRHFIKLLMRSDICDVLHFH